MRPWAWMCVLICIISFQTLIEDSYKTTYEMKNQNKTKENFKWLICIPLIGLNEINLNKSQTQLFDHFDEAKDIIDEDDRQHYERLILNQIKLKNYLFLRNQFCISFNDQLDLDDRNRLLMNFYRILMDQQYFIFNSKTLDLLKLETIYKILSDFDVLIVNNLDYPYSDCLNDRSKSFRLNKCFKDKSRLSKYIYNSNESGKMILDYDDNNEELIRNEIECFEENQKEDCSYVNIFPLRRDENAKFSIIIASSFISSFDYLAQLFGLIALFMNVCLFQLFSKYLNKLISKINQIKIKKYLVIFKFIFLTLLLICFLSSFIVQIIEFKNKQINPVRRQTEFKSTEATKFKLVICEEIFQIDNETLKEKSLSQIEQMTNESIEKTFKEIKPKLKFENKMRDVKMKKNSKILFKQHRLWLYRCIEIKIELNELNYERLFSISKLIIEFVKYRDEYKSYLLPQNQNFNSESYEIHSSRNYEKRIMKRSKSSNCVNYQSINLQCTHKESCFDLCISEKFIEIHRNISFYFNEEDDSGLVIDKDHFVSTQWRNTYLQENETAYNEIKKLCEDQIKNEDCNQEKFVYGSGKIEPIDEKIIEIDLTSQVIREIEEDPSIYILLMDLLNIQGILFGLNVFKVLTLIYELIKIRPKFNFYLLILIYTICTLGAIYHTYYILDEIVNEELVYSQSYEIINKIKIPEIILCSEFRNLSLDKNHEFTASYLNELTYDNSTDTVFDTIIYLNKSNNWIILDSLSNFQNDQIQIETLFFLDKKCFKINHKVEYDKNQFYFQDQNQVLGIYFNESFIHQPDFRFYLLTRLANRMEFVKNDLQLINEYYDDEAFKYLIYLEQFELIYDDKFNFIKNPHALLRGENDENDADKYLKGMMTQLKNEFNARSLNLPIEESSFDDVIDDDLFNQLYLQNKNKSDYHKAPNSNYSTKFAFNHIEGGDIDPIEPDLTFNLILFSKKLTITNSDNLAKLIVNLLNVLSIWFGLCVFDFHTFLYPIKYIPIYLANHIFKWLLKLKKFLFVRFYIDPHANWIATINIQMTSSKGKRRLRIKKFTIEYFNPIQCFD